jgi:DNA polymerase III alpha subunit
VSKSDPNVLIQPLTNIDGVGDKAIDEILKHRPFHTIEEFIFNEEMDYRRVNKKVLDSLILTGAMNCLMDDRFTGMKHFWSAVSVDRVKKESKFEENIETYAPEGDFTEEEKIKYEVDLTGLFPIHKVVNEELMNALKNNGVPPISEHDPELQAVWFVPLNVIEKKTSKGKNYWIVEVIDSNSNIVRVKCWYVRNTDILHVNRPYLINGIDYDPQWGFSVRSAKAFKLLG